MLRLLAFVIVATTGSSWPEHALEPADLARACERRDKERAEAREKLEREMDAAFAKAAAQTDAQLNVRHAGDPVLYGRESTTMAPLYSGWPVPTDVGRRLLVECIEAKPRDAGPMTILADDHGRAMQCWPEPR